MLVTNLFTILRLTSNEEGLEAKVEINAQNSLFNGHFPQQPVTPGVLQVQLVKELLEEKYGEKLELKTLNRCKFLAILNPNEQSVIDVVLIINKVEEVIKVSAVGKSDKESYFKFSATYQ